VGTRIPFLQPGQITGAVFGLLIGPPSLRASQVVAGHVGPTVPTPLTRTRAVGVNGNGFQAIWIYTPLVPA
jgi:hypothetical protein